MAEANKEYPRQEWESADVRFKTVLFGNGRGTRWKPAPTLPTFPPPEVDILQVTNWADVVFQVADLEIYEPVEPFVPTE